MCVSVCILAPVIRHAMRMRRVTLTAVACLAFQNSFTILIKLAGGSSYRTFLCPNSLGSKKINLFYLQIICCI